MERFGRLLRRMRGEKPVEELAKRAQVTVERWLDVEKGREKPGEREAHWMLRHAFQLSRQDAQRLILGLQLFDLGLQANDLRQLVIDLIQGVTPLPIREEVRRLYRSYAP